MKILVTGGAGFIGRALVPALVADGHQVRVFDNERRGSLRHPALEGCERCFGDLRDAEACRDACRGHEAIVHLAAQSNVMGSEADPGLTFATNVTGTWQLLLASREAGVRHLVFASSREVYGEPRRLPVCEDDELVGRNLYGASKIAGEALLRADGSGVPATILRLANVIGRGDSGRVVPNWLGAGARGEPLVLYGGAQVLDFVPVETVVAAVRSALARGPQPAPINIGSGVGISLRELAARVLALFPAARLEVVPARGPEVTRFVASIERMQALLGVTPPADPLGRLAEYVE